MIPYMLFVSPGLLAVFYFLFHHYRSKSSSSPSNLPPGSTGWPIIGESLAYSSAARKGQPEKFFNDRLRSGANGVFKTSLVGEQIAVLCGAAGNKFIFSNDAVWFPPSVTMLFPPSADKTEAPQAQSLLLRGVISAYHRPEALRFRHLTDADASARRHFAVEWDGREVVSVAEMAKRLVFWINARIYLRLNGVLLDNDNEMIERLYVPVCAVAAGIFSAPVDLPGTTMNRAMKAANAVRNEVVKDIQRRKKELERGGDGKEDIITEFLNARKDDGQCLNELNVADKTLAVLVSSHDSISAVCTLVVKFLAELPHVYSAVYDEHIKIAKSKAKGESLKWEDLQKMKYTWNVAQEVLRITNLTLGAFREATSDVTYGGFTIPKGWKLYWSGATTNMDPKCFNNPTQFDPSRFEGSGPAPYTFVPFGGGPRMCPGMEYARVIILVFVHSLVTRYRWEKVFPDEKITVGLATPVPAKGLPVRLFPHSSDNNKKCA